MNYKEDELELPQCSPEFLRALSAIFDTRIILRRKDVTLDYLRGVQDVLDYITLTNDNKE